MNIVYGLEVGDSSGLDPATSAHTSNRRGNDQSDGTVQRTGCSMTMWRITAEPEAESTRSATEAFPRKAKQSRGLMASLLRITSGGRERYISKRLRQEGMPVSAAIRRKAWWTPPLLSLTAPRDVKSESTSNGSGAFEASPCGATALDALTLPNGMPFKPEHVILQGLFIAARRRCFKARGQPVPSVASSRIQRWSSASSLLG